MTCVIMVVVVPLRYERSMRVALRLDKNGTLEDALEKLEELGLPGVDDDDDGNILNNNDSTNASADPHPAKPLLVACELVHNRLKAFNSLSRRVDSVQDRWDV